MALFSYELGIGTYGGVAQSVEHLPFKQVAGGSSPPTLTKFRKINGVTGR
jgi:hypothetical protein